MDRMETRTLQLVAVVAGSRSDQRVVDQVCDVLNEHDVDYEVRYLSMHRNHEELRRYVLKANVDLFIAVAGLSAGLPGFIASLTEKPVIGVPVSAKLGGLDALLSMVQMPSGVPVATVGIDNGKNAALLAVRILKLVEGQV